jgi:hypothetical protein
MAKRSTIPPDVDSADAAFVSKSTAGRAASAGADESRTVARVSIDIAGDIADRARNAVYWTPGLTLGKLFEDAARRALEELEKKNGGPFAPRPGDLPKGRPVK